MTDQDQGPLIGMDRKRSTIPLLMSVATATAVVPAPNPALGQAWLGPSASQST
jgi:hypothetical protein